MYYSNHIKIQNILPTSFSNIVYSFSSTVLQILTSINILIWNSCIYSNCRKTIFSNDHPWYIYRHPHCTFLSSTDFFTPYYSCVTVVLRMCYLIVQFVFTSVEILESNSHLEKCSKRKSLLIAVDTSWVVLPPSLLRSSSAARRSSVWDVRRWTSPETVGIHSIARLMCSDEKCRPSRGFHAQDHEHQPCSWTPPPPCSR